MKSLKMEYHDFEDDFYDNDEYDEFLFSSIKRYNVLQMFNLENIPEHIFQMDDSSICVISKRIKGENSEILKLSLPKKLTLPPELESRSKDNDFKVVSGRFTEGLVCKAGNLTSSKVITSEQNKSGFFIYDMNADSETKLALEDKVEYDFMVLKESQSLIIYKTYQKPLIQVDFNVGAILKEIEHPFQKFNVEENLQNWKYNRNDTNNIKCSKIDNSLIGILNVHTGDVVLHDLRTNNTFTSLPKLQTKHGEELWTLSTVDFYPSVINYFGVLSNYKSFCIYEKRMNTIVTQTGGDELETENLGNLKLKFSEMNNQFSVSGINCFVEIFKINKNNFDHVFTHNGHSPKNSKMHLVTDHIWLKANNKEFVISICNNKSLNCWDFNYS